MESGDTKFAVEISKPAVPVTANYDGRMLDPKWREHFAGLIDSVEDYRKF